MMTFAFMKPFFKFGLFTGMISGLWLLSSFTFVGWLSRAFFQGGIPATQIRAYGGLFSILILVIGIYLGMKKTKANGGGALSYGQAVKTGVIIAFITALIVSLFGLLYGTVINPGYADFMVKDTQHTLSAAGLSPAEISKRLEGVRKEFSTGAQVGESLIGQTVVGSIASLILGWFMRTKTVFLISALICAATFSYSQDSTRQFLGGLAQTGKLVTGYRSATGGKTIQGSSRTGKDGAYAADREVVSSIIVIRASGMDEASAIAKNCPIYEFDGSVEIRPVLNTAN
jgi:hypothetical protein